ncbi:hypothetical protein KBI52_09140, partial [Microvirga sp. HBU67558]|nr:hypothetical protein [Microvirga sp. HBU67558]
AEIYAIAREALSAGQRGFQFQSYPFRMTAENLAKHRLDPNIAFWKNLKEGSDTFEVTREEPQVGVGNGRYVFDAGDPSVAAAVAQIQQRDEQQVANLIARGVQPVRLVYADGGQNQAFREALSPGEDVSLAVDASARNRLGDVSRPEALAAGPREILLNANGSPRQRSPASTSYASQRSYE